LVKQDLSRKGKERPEETRVQRRESSGALVLSYDDPLGRMKD